MLPRIKGTAVTSGVTMIKRVLVAGSLILALAACNGAQLASGGSTRHLAPIPPATMALMSTKGVSKNDPILVRIYKKESELELYKRGRDGRYALLKTYPICRWSGQLGPKQREGDRQAPEGFYTVGPAQMNPNSSLYLSFDLGYPNAYDRSHGRSGSHLMVHGSCSSRGCFAMTDEAISEVYALAREAFAGGQRGFQVQSLPFRMTAENLAKYRADPNIAFWRNLKEGTDLFDVASVEPRVGVSGRRYAFAADDPSALQAVAEKQAKDEQEVASLIEKGTPAIQVVYDDGGSHQSFRDAVVAGKSTLGDVSRPDALAAGPREITVADVVKGRALAFSSTKPPYSSVIQPTTAPAPAQPAHRPIQVASATGETSVAMPVETKKAETPLYRRLFGSLFSASK
jgi:murein L,D-transpeptidase YafK